MNEPIIRGIPKAQTKHSLTSLSAVRAVIVSYLYPEGQEKCLSIFVLGEVGIENI